MLLSDSDIIEYVKQNLIGYTPFDEEKVNPASVDMTLSSQYRRPRSYVRYLDVRAIEPDHTEPFNSDVMVLAPGDFILATTRERVTIPDDLVARVEGKSSLGRLGLAVHITAGYIDPGFDGQVTLEIANLAPWSIALREGMRIAQIAFQTMTHPSNKPYGSRGVGHYQGQQGAVESKYKM